MRELTDRALAVLVLFAALALAWTGLSMDREAPSIEASSGAVEYEIPEGAFVIVVDAGHGGFDGGAVGTETGVAEAELNLKVAGLLRDELLSRGFFVIMTREGPEALAETKADDMQARKEIMQDERVKLVISVHMNKFRDRTVSGPMVFYMKGSSEGKAAADFIIASLCESLGRPARFSNPEDLFVLRVPQAPSVLVECGFLSNPDDERALVTEEYQKKLAEGIASGVSEYVGRLISGDNE
jgi:N-acetylmuramoyl-L-alanine amidase